MSGGLVSGVELSEGGGNCTAGELLLRGKDMPGVRL
jgi:hypothetical protein